MEPDDLKEFKEFLPSRAKLGRLSLWAPTEEERLAASRMLDVMRKAGIADKEPTPWEDSSWNPVNIPTLEEMKLSPTGLATLELFASLKQNSETKSAEPTVAPVEPEPAPAADPPAPPTIPDDGINDHLKALNWPPKPQQQPPQPKAEEPPDWVRHLDRPRITPWIDDSNNQPIY